MSASIRSLSRGVLFAVLFLPLFSHAQGRSLAQVKGRALDLVGGYLKGTGQEALSIKTEVEVPSVPEYVFWDTKAEHWNLFRNWGVDTDLAGLKLTIKLGFIRGTFDPYSQTYTVEPVITVLDNTLGDRSTIYPFLRRGEDQSYRCQHPGVDVAFRARFDGGAVDLVYRDWKTGELGHKTISYTQLLAPWRYYAGQHCGQFLGSTYCLVPQALWRDDKYRFGWLASERSPVYYTTGMPQDFVEVFMADKDGQRTFRPKASSLPLQAVFVLSPGDMYRWELRQMNPEEFNDAIIDGGHAARLSSPGAASFGAAGAVPK